MLAVAVLGATHSPNAAAQLLLRRGTGGSAGSAGGLAAPPAPPPQLRPGRGGCDAGAWPVVYAVATSTPRHALVKASRGHRRGARVVVLTNASRAGLAAEAAEGTAHCETWLHEPDLRIEDVPGIPGRPLLGESRLAAAAFLAAAALGRGSGSGPAGGPGLDFGWVATGDDDTLFFPEGVLATVAPLDPALPWFVTDNLYSRWAPGGFGARKRAPRCLPCGLNTSGLDLASLLAVQTCNCTPHAVCAGPWREQPGAPACSSRAPPLDGHHGGAGALLSRGLLAAVPLSRVAPCLAAHPHWLGDHALFQCLWRAGHAPTDPGWEARHPGQLLFDSLDGNVELLARLALLSTHGGATGGASAASTLGDGAGGPAAPGDAAALAQVLPRMVSLHCSVKRWRSPAAAADVMRRAHALLAAWRHAATAPREPGAAEGVERAAAWLLAEERAARRVA